MPNDGRRDVPDVSLLASGYYMICERDLNAAGGGSSTSCDLNPPYLDFQFEGGTSASVQAFAGIMAMVNQAHGRQGNANYVLYPLAVGANTCASNATAVSKTTCIFYDTQTGNNSVICVGGTPNCSSTTSGQYGIIASLGSAAYPATTGYDLATGLGSVNVANLVNNWKSNFTPNTTTLSLSTSPATTPIQLVHGQSVTYNISVTAGSGTPRGDVSLVAPIGNNASNTTYMGPYTLSGGSVMGFTNMLPAGSYSVTAHYAGDGTFATSDSTPGIPVTVSKEGSLPVLSLVDLSGAQPVYDTTATTLPYGAPYFLRVDVNSATRGRNCYNQGTEFISYACPSGTVTVTPAPTEAGAPPGTVPGH